MTIDYRSKTDLEIMVGRNEKILWRGKPDKKCFILEGIFNPLLPFAIFWGAFDMFFLTAVISGGGDQIGILVPFVLFHMLPVWIYLAGALFVFRRYKHTEYIITEKGVYASGGIFSYTCEMKPFAELSRIDIHRGIIDQMLDVGDVTFSGINTNNYYNTARSNARGDISITDIKDYQKVYIIVKQLQIDIYSDTMYPNDLRPAENHGYNTKYKGL